MATRSEKRKIYIWINGKQVKNSFKGIRGEMRKAQNELAQMTIGSKKYVQQTKKIKNMQRMLDKHHNAQGKIARGWKKIGQEIKTVAFGNIVGDLAMRGVQRIGQFFNDATDAAIQFSDVISQTQKTTLLDKKSVEELQSLLSSLDTRTGLKDLMGFARVGGKLGIRDLKDLRDFADAANVLNVALGRDLSGNVEKSINVLAKLSSVFGLNEIYGIGDALNRVGSVINELGKQSEANEQPVVNFLKSVGGTGRIANFRYEDLAAIGATLDSLGVSAEISGTALSKFFVNVGKNYKEYAKIAGMSNEAFKELTETNAMEAFIKILEGAKNSDKGVVALANVLDKLDIDAARASRVFGALVSKTDKLKRLWGIARDEMQEGTSALKEYNLLNENLAGTYEKMKKKLRGFSRGLGKALVPVLMIVIKGLIKFTDILKKVGSGIKEIWIAFEESFKGLKQLVKLFGVIGKSFIDFVSSLFDNNTVLNRLLDFLINKFVFVKKGFQSIIETMKYLSKLIYDSLKSSVLGILDFIGILKPLEKGLYRLKILFDDIVTGIKNFITANNLLSDVIKGATMTILAFVAGTKLYVLWTKLATLWTGKFNIISKISLALSKARKVAIYGLAAAKFLLAGNTKKATQAMRVMNTVIKGSHWGFLIAAIGAIAYAFYKWRENVKSLNNEMDYNENLQERAIGRAKEHEVELRKLYNRVKDVNLAQEKRKKALEEMKKKAPKIFEAYDIENYKIKKLNERLEKYIKLTRLRHKIQMAEKDIAQAESSKDVFKYRLDDEGYTWDDHNSNMFETASTFIESSAMMLMGRGYEKFNIKDFATGKLTGDLMTKLTKLDVKGEIEKANKEIKIKSNLLKDYYKELETLMNDMGVDEDDWDDNKDDFHLDEPTNIEKKIKRYGELVERINEFIEDESIKNLKKSDFSNALKKTKTQLKANTLEIKKYFNEQIDVVNAAIAELLKRKKENEGKLEQQDMDALFSLLEQRSELKSLKEKALLDAEIKAYGEYHQNAAEARDKINKVFLNETEKEIKAINDKYDELINLSNKYDLGLVEKLKAKRDKLIQEIKNKPDENLYENKLLSEREEGTTDIFGMTESDWERFMEIYAIANDLLKDIAESYGNILQARTNAEKKELEDYKRMQEQKRNVMDKRLEWGMMREDRYNMQVAKMEKDLAQKEKKMQIRQAQREKSMAIANARIKEAEGIVNIWSKWAHIPIVAGLLTAGLLAVSETNIAKIKSEEISAYGDGGEINKPEIALVGEKGPEIVLSNKVLKHPVYGGIANEMNDWQQGKFTNATAKPNFKKMNNSGTTVINNYNNPGNMENLFSGLRDDVKSMTKEIKNLKNIKAIVENQQLLDRDEDNRILDIYSKIK